jgi:raffinose/stachyose/melibiose transport system permease protein
MSALRFRILPTPYEQAERDKRRRQWNKGLIIAAFLLPGLIIFFLFMLMPIIQSTYFSLYDWNGFGPLTKFVGLGNYERLFAQKVFKTAVGNSFLLMVLSLVIQLPIALGLALLVGRGELKGKKIFRTILFVPYVFSEVITALIWRYVLHPEGGMLNTVLDTIFANYHSIGWLTDRNVVLYSLFIVLTWKYFGFYMILYMAGLQNVPADLEDAARVDGATELGVLRFITIPLLGSTIRLTIFLSVVGSFQQFVLAWVLTNEGAPANTSHLIATYLYKTWHSTQKMGFGSAIAVVLFAITFAFSLGYQRLVMKQDELTR